MKSTTSGLAAQYGFLSAAEAGALDEASAAAGVAVPQLMEIAGFQVARTAHELCTEAAIGRVAVVAGSGNNGGDGLVAARHLAAWGWEVAVHVIAEPSRWPLGGLAGPLRALGVSVEVDATGEGAMAGIRDGNPVLILDALLGTGLTSAPRPVHAAVIDAMAAATVLSVDLPSGLDATSGGAPGAVVQAARTCTLGAMKSGLWTDAGRRHAGDIWVADIGIPLAAWRSIGLEHPALVAGGALLRVPAE